MAIFKASGISASKARQKFGFERMKERTVVVEKSVIEAQRIREAVEELQQGINENLWNCGFSRLE